MLSLRVGVVGNLCIRDFKCLYLGFNFGGYSSFVLEDFLEVFVFCIFLGMLVSYCFRGFV